MLDLMQVAPRMLSDEVFPVLHAARNALLRSLGRKPLVLTDSLPPSSEPLLVDLITFNLEVRMCVIFVFIAALLFSPCMM
jgi:hypothetical protein